MNISEDGNSNAILLAVSCLIQEGRNAGEVQKIISDISSEFETKGNLSENYCKTFLMNTDKCPFLMWLGI